MSTPLLIGSCEPFSGKSAVVLGLARQLTRLGIEVMYGKPLATLAAGPEAAVSDLPRDPILPQDPDVPFIGSMLGLEVGQILPSVHVMESETAEQRLRTGDLSPGPGLAELRQRVAEAGDRAVLLEAAGSLNEGLLYGLGLAQLAETLGAIVILVHHWTDSRSVDALLAARHQLGERLVGVVLNGVPPEGVGELRRDLEPALARLGIPVLGVMPRSPLLRSVTVEELGRRLQARVLCCRERLDLLVETLSIGAMNVNSAMEFFRRRRNMAVVTGADRTDIQLAALEASTQCLILTGAGMPLSQLLNRAEELEVPVLKVEHDTLTTVEVIEAAIGHGRLHESVKATYAIRLVEEHCRLGPLFEQMGLSIRLGA